MCQDRAGQFARRGRPELGLGFGNSEPRPAGGGENALGDLLFVESRHFHMRTYMERRGKRFELSHGAVPTGAEIAALVPP